MHHFAYYSISFFLSLISLHFGNNLVLAILCSSQGFPLSRIQGLGEREMKLMESLYSQQAQYLLPICQINRPDGIP